MNRLELQAVLDEKGIRRRSYSLDGRFADDCYCIERTAGGWAVFYAERGNRNDEKWFHTEDAACAELLRRILDDPTTRVPLAVTEVE
jgi:hypothetical protein